MLCKCAGSYLWVRATMSTLFTKLLSPCLPPTLSAPKTMQSGGRPPFGCGEGHTGPQGVTHPEASPTRRCAALPSTLLWSLFAVLRCASGAGPPTWPQPRVLLRGRSGSTEAGSMEFRYGARPRRPFIVVSPKGPLVGPVAS